MGTIATGKNSIIKFKIERWSTDEERQKLITTFKEKGEDKLLDALQDMKKVGFIRLPETIGYDLQYARITPWRTVEGGSSWRPTAASVSGRPCTTLGSRIIRSP
jgi:hypothetical protein